MYGERAAEELVVVAHMGGLQLFVGEGAGGVGGAWGGVAGEPPFSAAVGGAGIGGALHGLGVALLHNQVAHGVADVEGSAAHIELEVGVGVFQCVVVEPYRDEAVWGNDAHVGGSLPFEQLVGVVAQVDAGQAHIADGGVVELHPSVEVDRRTHKLVYVGGHHLVYHQVVGGGFLLGLRSAGQGREQRRRIQQ